MQCLKEKSTNNDLQNITQTTKDRATRTPLRIGVNSGAPEGLVAPAPPVAPVVFLLFLWPHNETNFIHFIYTLVITKSCINHTSWVPSGDILDVIISEKNTVGFYMWEPFMKNTCYRFRHLTELTGTLRNVNRFIKITTSYF
jgi:hypothetical protein